MGTVTADLFTKPTDKHTYLRFDSAHPEPCKTGIPYSQFLLIRRICSSIVDFDRHAITMSIHFQKRGYPSSIIEQAYITARRQDRNLLLTYKPKSEDDDKLIFVTTFHPHYKEPTTIIKSNWDLLGKSSVTQHLHTLPLTHRLRRPHNLKDILMNAKIDFSMPTNPEPALKMSNGSMK